MDPDAGRMRPIPEDKEHREELRRVLEQSNRELADRISDTDPRRAGILKQGVQTLVVGEIITLKGMKFQVERIKRTKISLRALAG